MVNTNFMTLGSIAENYGNYGYKGFGQECATAARTLPTAPSEIQLLPNHSIPLTKTCTKQNYTQTDYQYCNAFHSSISQTIVFTFTSTVQPY